MKIVIGNSNICSTYIIRDAGIFSISHNSEAYWIHDTRKWDDDGFSRKYYNVDFRIDKNTTEGETITELLKKGTGNELLIQNYLLEIMFRHMTPENFMDMIDNCSKESYDAGYHAAKMDMIDNCSKESYDAGYHAAKHEIRTALGIE